MLHAALKGGYAVGYFEAWNEDSLEAILAAGEEANSPIIIGFGGMTVNQEWFDAWGLESFAAIGRVAVAKSKVPVCFILNEVHTYEQCLRGMGLGFNVVMLNSTRLSFDENVEVTRKLVEGAHAKGVGVEAELGRLPEAGNEQAGVSTDPGEAQAFVRATRVDALAVSIGNVHCSPGIEPQIDLNRLKAIHERAGVPLVIHGGSSFPRGVVKECIKLGVAKFNVGTILKKEYYSGLRLRMRDEIDSAEVQAIVGSREPSDFADQAKSRIREKVKEFAALYGSVGRSLDGRLGG
jgi:fructose-bisphosphate aldolase class II